MIQLAQESFQGPGAKTPQQHAGRGGGGGKEEQCCTEGLLVRGIEPIQDDDAAEADDDVGALRPMTTTATPIALARKIGSGGMDCSPKSADRVAASNSALP
jgi:hypothetical protein